MHGIIQLTDSAELVSVFRRIMIVSWSALYVQILYFSLFLTQKNKLYNGLIGNTIIMSIPVVNYVYYVLNPTTSSDLVDSSLGWIFLHPQGRGIVWDQLFNVYYLIYMFISIGLIVYWKKHSDSKREIKQANIILRGFIYVLILGSITDVILPMSGIVIIPPLSVVLILGVIASMCYAIIKYKLMNITPESIMMDVFMKMSEGIVITDDKNIIIGINSGTKKITGYSEHELVGKSLLTLFQVGERTDAFSSNEQVIRDIEDRTLNILVSRIYQYDQFDKVLGSVFTFQDITLLKDMQSQLEDAREKLEEKVYQRTKALSISNSKLKTEVKIRMEKEEEISRLIYNDYLTGLPNRRFLHTKIQGLMNEAEASNLSFAVIFLDLDNFKLVNDTMGHEVGDVLLKMVGKRLKETLRVNDCICRVGGDEFVILLENVKGKESVDRVCQKIMKSFESEFSINENTVYAKGSMGLSLYPDDGEDIESILENADIAMYRVKESHEKGYLYYNAAMRIGMDEVLYLTNELYKAVEEEQFEVYYQPQIDSITNSLTGFEALIRWMHPIRGMIMPCKFISLAEKTGLIHPIGDWVIRDVFKQLKVWAPFVEEDFTIGINLSPNQLLNPEFSKNLEQTANEFGIKTSQIEFEVTEGIFISKSPVIEENLSRLSKMGFSIAIDDFGTEYAAMTYLKFMPLNRIKIPKEFVEGIGVHKQDEAITKSIITLSKQLECDVIAEGVEMFEQVEFLKKNGCHTIQGYYYFKPICIHETNKQFFSLEFEGSQASVPIEYWTEM